MQIRKVIALAFAALLVACGGGGDDSDSGANAALQEAVQFRTPQAADLAPIISGQTRIVIGSDVGDYIGQGRTYSYTGANAVIQVTSNGGYLGLTIEGDQWWMADFVLPSARQRFVPGTYSNLARYPFHNATRGGLDWGGEGRGCNTLTGALRVNSAEYVNGALVFIDMDFVQHCEGAAPALFGNIRWFANDTSRPPRPVRNVPDSLWSPAPEAVPATGNFVYLESDAGDFIGLGRRYAPYTPRNANLTVTESAGYIAVAVAGDEGWSGSFRAMEALGRVREGWYRDLQRYPFHNPMKGGLSWSGEGRGCNTLQGWFVVDEVSYVDGKLATLDLRFEQHCEGGPAALRGRIRWSANDSTAAPGPRRIPENLWKPPEGTTPATGNYVYLDSQSGDYIGQGTDSLIRTNLSLSSNGRVLNVNAGGWSGTFTGMDSIRRLKVGYYPGVQRYPFHNPATGGLSWTGQGRGCNTVEGWFAIDKIVVDSLGLLMELDMRFSQSCEGTNPPLLGQIRWARPS